ncbi:MAG: hypothetical protein RL701_1603 [Pseudomonadota bacterium]|jgi:hypothetical protein
MTRIEKTAFASCCLVLLTLTACASRKPAAGVAGGAAATAATGSGVLPNASAGSGLASAGTRAPGSPAAGTGAAAAGSGAASSAAANGGGQGAASGLSGTSGASGSVSAGASGAAANLGPDPTPIDTAGPVKLDATPGRWRTALDPSTGRFQFISPNDQPAVLHGVSMTGAETGTRESQAGGGFWLYLSNQMPEAQNAPIVLKNVVKTLVTKWKTSVVRIPICGSAWTQNYVVQDWGKAKVANYKDWVDMAVQQARASGAVVIIDLHLWAIAKMGNGGGPDRGTFTSNGQTHKYSEYEDGCTGTNKVDGTDSCAPSDWYTQDPNIWQCAIANADGVTMENAYKNKDNISAMWADIATRYKGDSGVWFELFNEPYSRKADKPFPSEGANYDDKDYPWDLWSEYMLTQIKSIRDGSQSSNIILVNGLDWGYDFGPKYGAIANPDRYLPWKAQYANIAYAFHPYQHGACCGEIGASGADQSITDPYQSGFCSYYKDGTVWGAASGTALPGGKTCTNKGYAATQDKKMPPCTWVAAAWNPSTKGLGLCAGDRTVCGSKNEAECLATDASLPTAGGWSRYVLPMAKFGPLVATEFGSFDCSSPFVNTLLAYMNKFGISYTAWALWPQNSGGPEGLGSCGYPSTMTPAADPGDFRQCFNESGCDSLMQPLPWAGAATHKDLLSH